MYKQKHPLREQKWDGAETYGKSVSSGNPKPKHTNKDTLNVNTTMTGITHPSAGTPPDKQKPSKPVNPSPYLKYLWLCALISLSALAFTLYLSLTPIAGTNNILLHLNQNDFWMYGSAIGLSTISIMVASILILLNVRHRSKNKIIEVNNETPWKERLVFSLMLAAFFVNMFYMIFATKVQLTLT